MHVFCRYLLVGMGTIEPADDVALVVAARCGDHEAFGALYDRHGQLIYRYCYRHAADTSQAEDLLSTVFLEAWRCRERMALVDGSARAWLLGVAKNVTRARARANRRHAQALQRYSAAMTELVQPDHAAVVDSQVSAAAAARAIWVQIVLLPLAEREVAELCLLEGLTTAQTASALGLREGTVKSRLHRVRRRLQAVARTSETQTPAAPRGHVRDERAPRAPIDAMEMT